MSEITLNLELAGRQGHLSERTPLDVEFAEYSYDPRNPVPTIGGALTSGEPLMRAGLYDQRITPGIFTVPLEPEMIPLAERRDVLVFESEILSRDLALVGAPEIELYVSSDCPDTDFTAKLIDVYPPSADYPEGFAMNVTDGIFRMRYREGWDREVFMRKGEIYGIRIKPFATANLFKAGHRLRIDISSSNFPHFDINPNSGEPEGNWREMRVARNRIYTGGDYVSRVLLPILETFSNKG
jgi:putative CocE/NonD family hydrolase